jgi:glutaminyl-peptide cyclotransferase
MTCCSRILALGLFFALLISCSQEKSSALPIYDPAQPLWKNISGEKAMAHATTLVSFGPRPTGSEAWKKTRAYFTTELKKIGWETQEQIFKDKTPRGELEFANVRARFVGTASAPADLWSRRTPILLASHFDTKFYSNLTFVGANDGASGNAAMLEMARVFAERPATAAQIELIFFDGEEAVINFTPTDGLYGSRHYRDYIRTLPAENRPTDLVLLDMMGDKDLLVRFPANSSQSLVNHALSAADELGKRAHFGIDSVEILDDHVPLAQTGMAVINFIDFTFPAWHTSLDTLDTISAESLATSSQVAIHLIEKFLVPNAVATKKPN